MPVAPQTPSIVALDRQSSWRLMSSAETRQVEQAAHLLEAEDTLMERAGSSVARLALALWPHAGRVHVLAGPGGNGGDGLYAASVLQQQGRSVQVHLCAPSAIRSQAVARALAVAQASGVRIEFGSPLISADLVIDALLGIGGSRAPRGEVADAVAAAGPQAGPILSVDLPSGLDPDLGICAGHSAIQATHTLSLLTLKRGLFTGVGRQIAGRVWLDTLGSQDLWTTAVSSPSVGSGSPTYLCGQSQAVAALTPRLQHSHKGSFGDVLVLGGAPGMTGAAHLAAQACLAAGPGRTFLWLLDPTAPAGNSLRPECLGIPSGWRGASGLLKGKTVVCGCGAGSQVQAVMPEVLSLAERLVLDADGLNAVAADPTLQTLLRLRYDRGLPTVLTPHPLEAARLLGGTTQDVQNDRWSAAATLARQFNCTVVLKGSGTLIADARVIWVNPTGGPALATGGTGDVLAGWLAGLWGQIPPSMAEPAQATQVAAAAVWFHGQAADLLGAWPIRGLDLVESLRRAASSAA